MLSKLLSKKVSVRIAAQAASECSNLDAIFIHC